MTSAPPGGSPSLAPDVSIVVNAHREGVSAHPTFASLARACRVAARQAIRTEVVVVLDRADEATRAYVSSLVDDEVFDRSTEVRLLEVDHGDLGLSRNAGMQAARGPIAGVLDADNLVSENWLVEGTSAVRAEPDAVVHPAWIVGFGERRALWPIMSSDDPRFRPELLASHNYWDAFSLARRSTYLELPYAASDPGQGPEDWHWNIRTVAAGIRHVTAPGTALFYRVKGADSLMNQHTRAGNLLAPAALLVSRDLARSVSTRREIAVPRPDELPSGTPDVVRAVLAAPAEPYVDVAPAAAGVDFDPTHYRVLHHDLRSMDDAELARHWERFGRAERRRALLTPDEVAGLARWRPEHYLLLNPDLAALRTDELLDHFLRHGLDEGRRTWMSTEEIAAVAHLNVEDYLQLNPDLTGLTPEQGVAHFVQHGGGRPSRRPPEPPDVPAWLVDLWETACRVEPTLPVPTDAVVASFASYGHAPEEDVPASTTAWWDVVSRWEEDPDGLGVMLVTERLDEDGLADHLAAVQALDPALTSYVVVTGAADGRATPETAASLPGGTRVTRLAEAPGYARLDPAERARLVAELVVQMAPRVAHLWGRGAPLDALARHGAAMSQQAVIHLTVDGEGLSDRLSHPLLGRHPGHLDPVSTVWVDSPATIDRLWEIARLPRDRFVPRPPADLLAEVLATAPGYDHRDVPARERLWATPATAELLAGHEPVVVVVSGYEGYANLGDILQAKNLSRQWRRRGVTPVHVVSAGAVRTPADLDAARRDAGSPHLLLRGWDRTGPDADLGLVRVREVSPGGLLNIGGGGYLNRHWHRERMRDLRSATALARPRGLVVSGVQIDEAVVDALGELFDELPPTALGARDERSRALLEKTSAEVPAASSFDDATEIIVDWAAADASLVLGPQPGRTGGGTRIGLHLNTSDYAAHESVLDVVNAALCRLLEEDPTARLTVLHAYDDDRTLVADSLESLPRLRGRFVFDRFDVVDLARAARELDLDLGRVPSLRPLRELDLAVVASYHTAVLLGLLGVPTHLLATNPFYDDKAAGLGQHATLEQFLEDPRAHGIDLAEARGVRETWLSELDRALDELHVSAGRTGTR